MRKVVILGAGGLGREVLWVLEKNNKPDKVYEVMGFIDENIAKHGTLVNGLFVLGGVDWFKSQADADIEAICAIGNPKIKKHLVNEALKRNIKFISLIDPFSHISNNVRIGNGTVITAGAILTDNIVIGEHAYINLNCTIGHDVIIKDYVNINPLVAINGNIIIEDEVEIGSGVTIVPGITIGKNSFVCAGSVVTKDIEDNSVVGGIPARFIRRVSD